MAEENYVWNVVRLAVMWSASSFNLNMLLYLNKYLRGSIFINYYLDALAGFIGILLGGAIYSLWAVKISYIIAYSLTLMGAIGIILFETGAVQPYFVESLGVPPSGYEPGSK